MEKKSIQHLDLFGNPIPEKATLAVARDSELLICSIIKITPKMIRVSRIDSKYPSNFLTVPSSCIIVDGTDALAYVLKASK